MKKRKQAPSFRLWPCLFAPAPREILGRVVNSFIVIIRLVRFASSGIHDSKSKIKDHTVPFSKRRHGCVSE